mgnify:CR=1 FL=1
MPLKARAQNPCCQPGPPPVPAVSIPSEYEYVRRGDIFVPIFVQIVVGAANSDEDLCPEGNHPEAYDMWYVVGWDDHGAGGEFGYFDEGGRWVPHNGDRTTHYRISRGGEPIEPKVVRISVVVDDYALYADDPLKAAVHGAFDGYFTAWEFEIDPPYIDALPQDGATYTFTATIRPEKDHKGQSMARVIEFGLGSSAEPGYCMNATREQGLWTDTTVQDNDLKFFPNQSGLEVYAQGIHPTNYSIAWTVKPVLSASVQVRCLDYGAYGSIWVRADGLGLARLKGTLVERGAMIPRDENNNGIYDGWVYEPRPEGDQDINPLYGIGVGDGVVKYEEYRGFMINGSHYRTDPGQKMLWLVPEEGTTQFASKYHIGFAFNLMPAVYEIGENWKIEPDSLHPDWPNDRRINWMTRGFYGHTDQNAIRIIDGGYDPFSHGVTFPLIRNLTPNTTEVCMIFTEAIRQDFGQSSDRLTCEGIDVRAIMWIIAHEVGHSVGIVHYPWREGGINSVMAEAPDSPHPVFTNEVLIPSEYSDEDKAQMRLH